MAFVNFFAISERRRSCWEGRFLNTGLSSEDIGGVWCFGEEEEAEGGERSLAPPSLPAAPPPVAPLLLLSPGVFLSPDETHLICWPFSCSRRGCSNGFRVHIGFVKRHELECNCRILRRLHGEAVGRASRIDLKSGRMSPRRREEIDGKGGLTGGEEAAAAVCGGDRGGPRSIVGPYRISVRSVLGRSGNCRMRCLAI